MLAQSERTAQHSLCSMKKLLNGEIIAEALFEIDENDDDVEFSEVQPMDIGTLTFISTHRFACL